jgi:branched-chain amino acid transport system ATP-binding protein
LSGNGTPLLAVEGLNAHYGSAHVLQDVSFELGEQAVAIIGRNGMGKTTLCAAIMGIRPPQASGSVRFEGKELIGKSSHKIAGERKRNGGAQLSGGEQQMLAIGRALMLNPKLLIMDEPSEGLAPAIIEMLVETFRALEQEGLRILLIEQNLGVATSLAERQLVMVGGEIAAETTASKLTADPELQRRYLGVEPVRHGA